jgi:hypothetical protein
MQCSCGQENPASQHRCQRCGRRLILGVDLLQGLRDASVLVLLLAALGLIFGLQKHVVSSGGAADAVHHAVQAVDERALAAAPQEAAPLRLAVTPPDYDDMGHMLDTLGTGYRYHQIEFDDLLRAEKLESYDVVFLTCSGVPRPWLGRRLGSADRGSPGRFAARPEILEQLTESLRRYVRQGGTLYASDWQFDLVSMVFAEFVDNALINRGSAQRIRAEVLDPTLQRRLGSRIELRFDKPSWRPAAFAGPEVTVYLRGSYETSDGRRATAPLLVSFPFGNGMVIFTSFHNEAQHSATELELLRHLVFTTVTARLDTDIRRTMVRGGFSPTQRSLLSASSSDLSVVQRYECRATHDLQFVLGFEDRGARLQLSVTGPDGRPLTQAGRSTVTIDVPQAAPGTWVYKITPLAVPYANFPYTLTVGEK